MAGIRHRNRLNGSIPLTRGFSDHPSSKSRSSTNASIRIGIRNRLCRHPVRPARVPNASRRESVHPNTRLSYLVPEPMRRTSLTVREIHCSRPESARQTEISWPPGSQMSSKKDCRLSPLTMDKGNPPWRRCVESPAFSDKRRTPLHASFPPPDGAATSRFQCITATGSRRPRNIEYPRS